MKETPMMKQYLDVKRQYPDKLVLFRMGDFYETFGDDAKQAAKILNITLTTRDKKSDPTPLAGFPYHALEQYLPKIVQAGASAVIVEQLEDPKKAVGIVKRGVTRIVTPGTLDGELADDTKSPYILALYSSKNELAAALVDISTGEFKVTVCENSQSTLNHLLSSFAPAEILILSKNFSLDIKNHLVQPMPLELNNSDYCENLICEFYKLRNINALGLESKPLNHSIAFALYYIQETQKMNPDHIDKPRKFTLEGTMVLDQATINNLELVSSQGSGGYKHTLYYTLNECKTNMGKRLLYSWVLNPLIKSDQINERLEIVDTFYKDDSLLSQARELLAEIYDIERIVGKVGLNRANARDLKSLAHSLEKSAKFKELISGKLGQHEKRLNNILNSKKLSLTELATKIDSAIVDSPPLTITEGNFIKEGFNKELDEIRSVALNSKEWVKQFIETEKQRTNIPSMKIGFTKVFGYYIEVTKAHLDKVPAHFIRKQTLVNAERFITQELKQKEEIILGAQERLAALEYEIFQKMRLDLIEYLNLLRELSQEIARFDILTGFAHSARARSYCLPEILKKDKKGPLEIIGGRHPVVESTSEIQFVSNDTTLDLVENRMAILTGPNMSGKSTYIRQTALITLMAQIGSFVPAQSFRLSIVDRIFTRVGASDDLAAGRSTFMVEMDEAAAILNNATEQSLIILDEVGRGTSTYDGVSIAWALAEHLLLKTKARTLFATHYHELLELSEIHQNGIINLKVLVEEDEVNDEVIFMHKIVPGSVDRSYGIYVAKMAGLPDELINRAKEILNELEDQKDSDLKLSSRYKKDKQVAASKSKAQVEIQYGLIPTQSVEEKQSEVEKELEQIDLNSLTPIEALNLLNELKQKLPK